MHKIKYILFYTKVQTPHILNFEANFKEITFFNNEKVI